MLACSMLDTGDGKGTEEDEEELSHSSVNPSTNQCELYPSDNGKPVIISKVFDNTHATVGP
jgi:hypothetical protein